MVLMQPQIMKNNQPIYQGKYKTLHSHRRRFSQHTFVIAIYLRFREEPIIHPSLRERKRKERIEKKLKPEAGRGEGDGEEGVGKIIQKYRLKIKTS